MARTLDVWLASYKHTLKELGIDKTDREITAVFGDWHGGVKLGAPDNDQFFNRVDELVKNKMPTIDLQPGAKNTIKKLNRDGCHMAILTSSLREYTIPALKYHNLINMFEIIITGEDVKKHKPDPEVVNLAIERFGTNKETSVMIGDSDKDVFAARNAGIDSILYYPEEHKLYYNLETLRKSKPTYLARSFEDVFKQLTQ